MVLLNSHIKNTNKPQPHQKKKTTNLSMRNYGLQTAKSNNYVAKFKYLNTQDKAKAVRPSVCKTKLMAILRSNAQKINFIIFMV